MSIFAILMLLLMNIFSATQNVWRSSSAKASSAESARIALDIIARTLESAVYLPEDSFHYSNSANPRIEYSSTQTYAKNTNIVQARYAFRLYSPDSNDIYNLEFSRTVDNASSANFSNKLLLENIVNLEITPNFSGTELPKSVIVKLGILDDDENVKQKFLSATTEETKKALTRYYTRDILIKQYVGGAL